jgi:hypothetical protein
MLFGRVAGRLGGRLLYLTAADEPVEVGQFPYPDGLVEAGGGQGMSVGGQTLLRVPR